MRTRKTTPTLRYFHNLSRQLIIAHKQTLWSCCTSKIFPKVLNHSYRTQWQAAAPRCHEFEGEIKDTQGFPCPQRMTSFLACLPKPTLCWVDCEAWLFFFLSQGKAVWKWDFNFFFFKWVGGQLALDLSLDRGKNNRLSYNSFFS